MITGSDSMEGLLPAIDRFDLVTYVREKGAVQIQGVEWSLICPSCGKDKLIVNTDKKTWHCWVCQQYAAVITSGGVKRRAISGAGGLIDLIELLESLDRVTAARKILAAGHMTAGELSYLQDIAFKTTTGGIVASPQEIDFPECATPEFAPQGLETAYALSRGISMEDIELFGLRWCWHGRYAHRLVFPVYENGLLVYWQARAMWDQVPGQRYIKSLNPPKTVGTSVSSEILMNLDVARHFERVAITEGPIDLIHVGPSAVCTFGKRITAVQVAKLLQAGVKAIDFVWDADAYVEAVRAAAEMESLFDVRVVQLPKGDPGDYTREENSWYRDGAQRLPGLQVLI